MSERKFVRKSNAIILGVLCIVLLGITVSVTIYYNNMNNTYATNHNYTDSDYKAITTQLAAANANISSLTSQVSNLKNELSSGNNSTQPDLESQITDLTAQLAATQTNLTTNKYYYEGIEYIENTQISDLTNQLTAANNQIVFLQNQVNSLNGTLNLQSSTTWVNNQTISQPADTYTVWTESAGYAGYVSIYVSSATTSSIYTNLTYSAYGVNYNQTTNVGSSGIAYFPIVPSSKVTIEVGNELLNGNATEIVTITYYY